MDIRERTVGNVSVLDVAGRMVLGDRASDTLFRSKVNELLAATPPRLVIDLEQVAQVDTSGLTALVTAHLTAAKRGGGLKLVRPSARIRELLHITRLDTLFEMFESEEAAIESFGN
jgi:anti-sigma B factor antagonist